MPDFLFTPDDAVVKVGNYDCNTAAVQLSWNRVTEPIYAYNDSIFKRAAIGNQLIRGVILVQESEAFYFLKLCIKSKEPNTQQHRSIMDDILGPNITVPYSPPGPLGGGGGGIKGDPLTNITLSITFKDNNAKILHGYRVSDCTISTQSFQVSWKELEGTAYTFIGKVIEPIYEPFASSPTSSGDTAITDSKMSVKGKQTSGGKGYASWTDPQYGVINK